MNENVSCSEPQCAQVNSEKEVISLWLYDVSISLQVYCLTNPNTLMVFDGPQNNPWPIPSDIGNLRNLTFLLLNNIAGEVIPKTMGELKQLKSLLLRGKHVLELPNSLSALSNLSRLDLDLPLVHLSSFLSTLPLSRLDISSNARFTVVPTDFFKNLNPTLSWLAMTTSNLVSLDPFVDLTNLTLLWIYTNRSSVYPWQFTYLPSLTNIAFGSSQKMSSLPQNFSKTLEILDLSSNAFTEIPPEVVQSKNLQRLSMISNYITDIRALTQLTAPLDYVDLTNNKIETVAKEINRLGDRLSSLFLGANQLRTVPATEIVKTEKLRILDLRSNPINSSEIVRLKTIFITNPNLTVLF